MPGEWLIGLGKGLSDASSSVDLWAKMRESRERTELERQQNEANAAYQRGQLERESERNKQAQEEHMWNVLKHRVENTPLDAPLTAEDAAAWEKGGFGSFVRKEAPSLESLGGRPLYAGTPGVRPNMAGRDMAPSGNTWTMRPSADPRTHVPVGPGGRDPRVHEPTSASDVLSRIPPGLPGAGGAPMMSTQGSPGSDTEQYFSRGTETARTRAQEYAAQLRAASAASATRADEQRALLTFLAANQRNNAGGLDSLRDFIAYMEANRVRELNAGGGGNQNNYGAQNYEIAMQQARLDVDGPLGTGGLSMTPQEYSAAVMAKADEIFAKMPNRFGAQNRFGVGGGGPDGKPLTGAGGAAIVGPADVQRPAGITLPQQNQGQGPAGLIDPRHEEARRYLRDRNKISPDPNDPKSNAIIAHFLQTTPGFGTNRPGYR